MFQRIKVASYYACDRVNSTVECFFGNAGSRRRRKNLSELTKRLLHLDTPRYDEDRRLRVLTSLEDSVLEALTSAVLNHHRYFRTGQVTTVSTSGSSTNASDIAKTCFTCPGQELLLNLFFAWFRPTAPVTSCNQLKCLPYLCHMQHCCNPYHYALVYIAG